MKIYKYRSIDIHSLSMINEGNIYYSRVADLNDPFEGDFRFSTASKLYKTMIGDSDHELGITTLATLQQKLKRSSFVSSFSKINDNILMWSHYADNHRGICIEFDHENGNPFFTNHFHNSPYQTNANHNCHEMEYDNSPIELECDGDININYCKTLLKKNKNWEYEQEIRFIQYSNRIKSNGFTQAIDKKMITGVYLGAKLSDSDIDQFVADIDPSIKLYKMKMIHGCYRLATIQF